MACLDNIEIRQTINHNPNPNISTGVLEGVLTIDVLNTFGNPVDGLVYIDNVRDLTGDLEDPAIESILDLTGETQSYNVNFYYPDNEPTSSIINVTVFAIIDDCVYENSYNHPLLVSDGSELATSTNTNSVQGFEVISGCTDSAYYEYDPLANFDDGSCFKLRPVIGCTNQLASNYDPNATYNDGTCIFKSGCTNPLAINYDPDAVIDDFSCECGDINIKLDFFPSGESIEIKDNCDYFIEFDLLSEIDCLGVIDYFERNEGLRLLDVFNALSINFQLFSLYKEEGGTVEYTGGTLNYSGATEYILDQEEELWKFDISVDPIGLSLTGEGCDLLLDLIAVDLGFECEDFDKSLFRRNWGTYRIGLSSGLAKRFTQIVLNYKNFKFGLYSYIDNIKIVEICENVEEKCVLIPKTFGFDLFKVVDNRKSWVYSEENQNRVYNGLKGRNTDYDVSDERLVFNTKNLELNLNPVKYVNNDVIKYFNAYGEFVNVDFLKELNLKNLNESFVDVKNRQTIRNYSRYDYIYNYYLNGLKCAESKKLNYEFVFDAIDKAGVFWYNLVKQLVPLTTIWDERQFVLKNNAFHQPKHVYKKYSITNGDGSSGKCDLSGATISCNKVTSDCFSNEYSSIDDILKEGVSNLVCSNTGDSVCFTEFIGDGSFTGKLIKYETTTGDTLNILESIGYDDYDCLIPSGDTDICDSVTILPNISYDCIQVSGENTGFATLSISPSGGTAPYTITGGFDGQTVEDGGTLNIVVTDSNGCQSDSSAGIITIDCPSGSTGDTCTPIDCSSNVNQFQLDVEIENPNDAVNNYVLSFTLSSPNYSGDIVGSYKVHGLQFPEIVDTNSRYHSAADLTPNVGVSDYIEFGFNQFTPVSPSNTDSPWSFSVLEDLTNIPDWIPANTSLIEVALYDEDYCVHKGSANIVIPSDGNTSNITINF